MSDSYDKCIMWYEEIDKKRKKNVRWVLKIFGC